MDKQDDKDRFCAAEIRTATSSLEGSAMRVLSGAADLGDLVDFLSLVLDNVYSGIIVCDSDCRIVFMNRVYGELLGTDPTKVVGQYLEKYFPHTRMPQVLSTGRSELAQRCSLKTDMPMLVNRIPLRVKGQVVGVILQTIFRDYTAITDLISRLQGLESEVKYYKKGLDRVLSPLYSFESIVGSSPVLAGVKAVAAKYARTEAPVLITGPTGTGKEMFAHAVHSASPRERGPFVCVNCAAIPRELLESELFGYESGAFTGASRKGKVGQIQLAHMGTLFLDEIGELSVKAQVKLLRVLETKMLERLGGVKPVAVDFRLVAATNRDLKEMMRRGEFRDDLYYRLSTMAVGIPPLSQRGGDIEVLVRHFLLAMDHPELPVNPQAMDALKSYSWPGNVRELKNVIERAVSLSEGKEIGLEQLPREVLHLGAEDSQVYEDSDSPLVEQMARFEKRALERALRLNLGNMTKTAKMLGISRSTLYEKCRRFDLGEANKTV
ncbi:MAG: sigma 54-interacting transcriptional regulator [Proteobacteria bacterium]|nr:sigma 54-interacting transcriptional regulator [Pseudomonadota bacterium]MBU1449441.1 sigma 54-interacting transcriptional regulator [Pseudomonadota bacterium]MBU2467404.1 sigma 54-interacting transcriptional regulator [Pseudomonadota bacterium]